VDRLFLGANVLFSAAYREGAGVARLWHLSQVVLLTSAYAVEEARRNLAEAQQRERLTTLLASVEIAPAMTLDTPLRADIVLPEKDWPILGGAVNSKATHLITGDLRDFGTYFGKQVFGILILPPAEYLRSRS